MFHSCHSSVITLIPITCNIQYCATSSAHDFEDGLFLHAHTLAGPVELESESIYVEFCPYVLFLEEPNYLKGDLRAPPRLLTNAQNNPRLGFN
jgi:hypothetical protein